MSIKRDITASVRVLQQTPDPLRAFWTAARNCYYKGSLEELEGEYSAMKAELLFHKIIALGHSTCLEHITFQIALEGVSRSFMAQITRHRHVTFHISSQHFQNHSNFLFVIPPFKNKKNIDIFLGVMDYLDDVYQELIKNGEPHYLAREVLPNATACKIIMSLNLRELRHIIELRQGPENTPEMRMIMDLIIMRINEVNPIFLWGMVI